ncbi:MAG: nitroreductase family protein [Thermodesulfobacteriota bacterium]|nr:nitroreductase family protein [Thermodesulfobacteriota bacterium]
MTTTQPTTIEDLVRKNRTCRRFYENQPVNRGTLCHLVNLARLSASAANRQPLKYILSWEKKKNQMIFPCLAWAGYLTEWNGPGAGERPAAYIIITGDTTITDNFWCDHGIAAQSILLGAREMGLAGCMIGAFNEKKLRADLAIPDHLILLLVIALGKPKEQVVIEEVGPDNDIRYWRDESGIHHVPKRKLEDIIVVSGNP